MALFGAIFLVVMLVLIGMGIAIGTFISILLFTLVSLGVISSSVVVGFRRRSAAAGIRTFLLLCGVIGGIPCGILGAWLARSFIEIAKDDAKIFIYGGLSGAIGGLVIALMLDYILRRSSGWIVGRVKGHGTQAPAGAADLNRPAR